MPLADVQQLIADGVLSDSDRVRADSTEDWITVVDLPTAAEAIAVSAQAAGVADAATDDDRHDDLDIDSFSFENNPAEEQETNAPGGDLDIDSFNLAGDSDSPQPVVTNPHKPIEEEEEEEDESIFFVQSLGEIWGPLTQEELVDMACSGSLSRGDEIREGEDGRWIAVEAIPGVGEEILRQQAIIEAETKDGGAPKKKKTPPKKRPRKKKPTAKRRKRKKKAKPDEFLQEIFAEVFTEDGKVREDRAAAPAPPPPIAGTAVPGGAGVTPGATVAPAAGIPAAGMTGASSVSAPPPMAAASAKPAFAKPKPPAKPRRSSGGGGMSFSMPEPKVLGIIGGGVVVLLLIVGAFMGGLPGFGVNPETLFKDFATEYASAQKGSPEDWLQLRQNFAGSARSLATDLAPQVGTDPNAHKQYRAAVMIMKILARRQDDESITELYAEFDKVLVGG